MSAPVVSNLYEREMTLLENKKSVVASDMELARSCRISPYLTSKPSEAGLM